ncbi:MAG: ATP synthase F1 subunit epsilon [Chloroflexi bacterium]|nr:ATP synthase F1 subunit epsilon [Chloroflexota bacterium]
MPFRLEIVTLDRQVFAEDIDFVVVPGTEGELGILAHHAPLISALKPGELRIRRGSDVQYYAVGGGFVRVLPDKVVVLADDVQHADEIDESRAQEAREIAERELREFPERSAELKHTIRFHSARLQVAQRRSTARRSRTGPSGS